MTLFKTSNCSATWKSIASLICNLLPHFIWFNSQTNYSVIVFTYCLSEVRGGAERERVHACMCVAVCMHMCVCVCVCMRGCVHPNTCICARMWINACVCLPVCSLQAFLLSQHVPRDLYKHCTFSHSDILNAPYCIMMWCCAMLQDVTTDIAFTCSCSCLAIVDCWDMKTGLWVIFFPSG